MHCFSYVLEERKPSNDPFVAQLILANFEHNKIMSFRRGTSYPEKDYNLTTNAIAAINRRRVGATLSSVRV